MKLIQSLWQRLIKRESDAFISGMYKENTERMMALGIILFLADALYIAIFAESMTRQDLLFNIVVISVVGLTLPIFAYVYYLKKTFSSAWYRGFAIAVTTVLMLTAVWFTLDLQSTTDRITPYIFSLVAIMVIVQLEPIYALLVISFVNVVFIANIYHYQDNVMIANTHVFNSLLMSLIILIMAFYTYSYRQKLFEYVRTIEEKTQTLQQLSVRDAMSGLYNYKYGLERMKEAAHRYQRERRPFTILLLDIDNFKQINDNFGHIYGDQAIKEVADAMLKNLRKSDIAVRYGGDEFIVILPNTSIVDARRIAEKIKNAIAEVGNRDIPITISGGVNQYDGQDVEAFINQTDKLLYQAKSLGKDSIVCSDAQVLS